MTELRHKLRCPAVGGCTCALKERQRIKALEDEVAALQPAEVLSRYRGIRGTPCSKCKGWGRFYYPNTGTWTNAKIVGRGFTWGTCDACWGSGDEERPGVDLRELEAGKR